MSARSTPTTDEAERMLFVQGEIERALLRFLENTEPMLLVGAMMRCSRVLLDRYPDAVRGEFIEASVAFLMHAKEVGADASLAALPEFRRVQ